MFNAKMTSYSNCTQKQSVYQPAVKSVSAVEISARVEKKNI